MFGPRSKKPQKYIAFVLFTPYFASTFFANKQIKRIGQIKPFKQAAAMRKKLTDVLYSFPFQLVVLHLRSNLLLLAVWLMVVTMVA